MENFMKYNFSFFFFFYSFGVGEWRTTRNMKKVELTVQNLKFNFRYITMWSGKNQKW